MPSRPLRSSGGQLERFLEVLAEGVTVHDDEGRLVFANPVALERMGIRMLGQALAAAPGELLARFEISDEKGVPLDPEQLPGRRLLRGEDPGAMLLRWVERRTGRSRWTVVKATAFQDDDGRRLAVNVIEDVTETKEQQLREQFLARASEVLSAPLDYRETMREVARLAVPELADWCAVERSRGSYASATRRGLTTRPAWVRSCAPAGRSSIRPSRTSCSSRTRAIPRTFG